jgi:hypothetical protein
LGNDPTSFKVEPDPECVLFLDIDGVINTNSNFRATGPGFSHEKIELIRKILSMTHATVVLASSWRRDISVSQLLGRLGIPIHDKTPYLLGRPRKYEILEYLSKHPEIKVFAILDDDADAYIKANESFFKTDSMVGVTEEIADNIIEHINKVRLKDVKEIVTKHSKAMIELAKGPDDPSL